MGFFTIDHYKQGLTMAVGSIIICSIIFQDAFIKAFKPYTPPALALVMWSSFCPPFPGVSTVIYPITIVGDLLGIVAYLLMIYITYGVTGPDYSPGVEKAVTITIVGTIVVAILHLLRVRFPGFNFAGMTAQLLSTIVTFVFYWGDTLFHPTRHIWHMLVITAIPVVTGTLVSFFIVPNPAGKKCLVLFGQLLETTAHLQNEVIEKLLLAEGKDGGENKDINPTAVVEIGMLARGKEDIAALTGFDTSTMPEGRYVGIAAELEPIVVPIHKLDIQAWQLAVGINGLAKLSALEVDVYSRPHIFPRKEFLAVLTPVRIMEHLYMAVVNFLGRGTMRNNTAFLLLKNELEELRAAVEMNCKTLKQVIVDGYEYEKGLTECVPRLEAACLALKEKMTENEKLQSSAGDSAGDGGAVLSDEFIIAHELVSLLVLAGKEIPRAWEKVPALIAVRQPDAAAVAESFFAAKAEKSQPDEKKSAVESNAAAPVVLPPASSQAVATDSLPPSPPQSFREVLHLVPSCNSFRQKLYLASLSTGIHSWHWKIVAQMSLCFAIAATLNVIYPVRVALDHRSYWIIVTVMMISDVTTGGVVDNGVQRIAGTALGSAGIALLAGLAYVANGSTYIGSSLAKKLTESVIVTIWLSVIKLFNTKYSPRFTKMFNIASLVVPLIALMDATGEDVWVSIGFRIAVTCIGVGVYVFSTLACFPMTAEDHIKEKTADCLLRVADMLKGIAALPLTAPPLSFDSSLEDSSTVKNKKKKKKKNSCFGLNNRKKKTASSSTTSSATPFEEDVETAATSIDVEDKVEPQEQDAGALAANAIVSNGLQQACASLMDIIRLRDIVDKEYFVSKFYYNSMKKIEPSSSDSSDSAASLPVSSSSSQNKGIIDPEDLHIENYDDHYQQQKKKSSCCGKVSSSCGFDFKVKPPLQVYHLDQLVSHLKQNIVYSGIALQIREWLRTQNSFFVRSPEVAGVLKTFVQQSEECFRGLRLAILGLVKPEEALQTVLNLRKMASDILQVCNSKEQVEETAVVHVILSTCQNIELLFRATHRALGTHADSDMGSIIDRELGGQTGVSMLSSLNAEATATAVQAMTVEEESGAEADDKKGGAGKTRDGVQELGGMTQIM